MTVQHRRAGNFAVVEPSGRYAVAELREAIEASVADFDPGVAAGLLVDITGSTSMGDRPTEDVRSMAYFIASMGDRFSHRLALVASSDVAYGLMRLGAVVAESQGLTTGVFRDRAEGYGWLASFAR